MIWIRADANPEIGSGHVMRCLSIAAALKKSGKRVCFILADESAAPLLRKQGQEYRVLQTPYDNMEQELVPLTELLKKEAPTLLLVDSYFVTEQYFRTVRKYVKTLYLDDIPRFAYPVDGIINYNIYGEGMAYEWLPRERLWLGMSYAPLREQFLGIAYEVRPQVKKVLITTGGSDKYNLAGSILRAVLAREETAGLCYQVISGAFNPYLADLRELAEQHENIGLHQNVTNMAELMQQADIAITAGGSTMYELCAVGVPVLCFSFVDNQELIVEAFGKRKLVHYAGNYLKEQQDFSENVAEALEELAGSLRLRQQYSREERKLVDGCGAMRLAAVLSECGEEQHGRR